MTETTTVSVHHGSRRAVFVREAAGWVPDWFYEGERPMLRLKDHEWLSLGHVRPTHAAEAEELRCGGAVFRGSTPYGNVPVAWAVSVRPDPDGEGFVVECAFTPEESIELLEAYTAFETPYEYDGRETATTVIGMNPVSRWRGAERLTPPIFENPAWVYSRPQAARITAPCSAPYLCQTLTDAPGLPGRCITIVGDWNVCKVHDLYVTPTRDTAHSPAGNWRRASETRGYKYIVGALNWSSAYAKDPNVLFAGGEEHRQRVVVDFRSALPEGLLDMLLLRAWQRAALLDVPPDGRVDAFDRAAGRGVTWQAAVRWLRDVFCSDQPTEGLYTPGKGIRTYAAGTRPKAGDDSSFQWWLQWAGPLRYRAILTADEELAAACDRNDQHFADSARRFDYYGWINASVTVLPSLWWIAGGGRDGTLHTALRPVLDRALETSAAEKPRERTMDYGAQAAVAEALLLGAEAYRDDAMRRQALVLLDEMAEQLDGSFWEFNVGHRGSLMHGGQIRSLGHGHAILANLLAARHTGDDAFLARAQRFARYLLAVSYTTHNGSADPDFDWRGWCNGSNAGRDQIAEFPPWETQNGLLCIAAFMENAELEPAFYDVLWYIARTGLAQFPAARTLKRVLDERMQPHYVPRDQIASERDFYDTLPYLAYENPHDQTLLASYQGSDCILGEFVYGSGLASASDDRLGVIVPRAATMDLRETGERLVHVWNPTQQTIAATLAATWADGARATAQLELPPRSVARHVLTKPAPPGERSVGRDDRHD